MTTEALSDLWTSEQVKHHLQTQQASLTAAGMPSLVLNAALVINDLSDGNINQVFRVSDGRHSVIVKHAPPFLRVVGPSWPLSTARNTIEVNYLRQAAALVPDRVPRIYDHVDATLVMQDLQPHQNVRYALIAQQTLPHLGAHLGEFMATLTFHTSLFSQSLRAIAVARQEYHNPDPCKITEELFFSDPYHVDAPTNRFSPTLRPLMQELASDTALHHAVAALKQRFLNCPTRECSLIHGDLHTGSVLATLGDTQILDGEFACYGPVGFDIGTVLANLMINHQAQQGLEPNADKRLLYQAYLREQIHAVWDTFQRQFRRLVQGKEGVDAFLANAWRDTVGYAGTECIRRTVGLAHVADIERIAHPEHKTDIEMQVVTFGRQLITEADKIETPAALTSLLLKNAAALSTPFSDLFSHE